MKKYYVAANLKKDPDLKMTTKIVDYLETHGCSCQVRTMQGKEKVECDQIPPDTECILVIGGDGTLLHAAKDTNELQIPLIGFNMGRLGYLAEIERDNITNALDRLIEDKHKIEHRMMLSGTLIRDGQEIKSGIALNDIVISKAFGEKLLHLTTRVNGTNLTDYNADGILISTATGSTAYNLSLGGPIISPETRLFVLTPIAAHTLIQRSIVLPPDSQIEICLNMRKNDVLSEAGVSFDGDMDMPVKSGDRLLLKQAQKDTLIAKIYDTGFLYVLAKKMNH